MVTQIINTNQFLRNWNIPFNILFQCCSTSFFSNLLRFINNEYTIWKLSTDIVDDDMNINVSNIRHTMRVNKCNDFHLRNNDYSIDCSYSMHPLKKKNMLNSEWIWLYFSETDIFKKHIGTSNKNIDTYVCAWEG